MKHTSLRGASFTRGLIRDDRGAATAEYAIATMAAVGLAGILVGILKGNIVQQLLTNLITGALTLGG
jgi:Flp pilus assembly pilin Flp